MADAELVLLNTESTTAKVEQLGVAFNQLEYHRNSSMHNKNQWEEIREYLKNLEKSLKDKFDGLEDKEKSFKEKQCETQILLAERESIFAAKEHAMLDRLQDLKDIAVSDIAEARKKCKMDIPVPADIDESKGNNLSCITNGDSDAPVSVPGENFPVRSGECAVATAVEPRPQLKQFCKEMDAHGLLKFISKNQKHHKSLCKELSVALKSASEPARLVLDSLENFYLPNQPAPLGNEKDVTLQTLRRNCLILLESAAPLIGITEAGGDNSVNFEYKQKAKAIAEEWRSQLAALDLDGSHGQSAEAHAFLQLIVTFGIASNFDEDELCKLVVAISRRKQASQICRSLGLAHKAPGMVEALVNSGRQLDAVHFAYAFQLSKSFPPAPLLMAFLNDMNKSVVETYGDASAADVQKNANSQELKALRLVIGCIENDKLQEKIPLGPLQTRVAQLKKAKMDKGTPESTKFHAKKPKFNAGCTPGKPARFVDRENPLTDFVDRGLYGWVPEWYSFGAPTHEAPSHHTSFVQQTNIQRSYHYPAQRALLPASYNASNYGSHVDSGLHTISTNYGNYMGCGGYQPAQANQQGVQIASANHGNYMGSSYQPTQANYEGLQTAPTYPGNYMGSGYQPAQVNYGGMQTVSVDPGNQMCSGSQPAQANYGGYAGAALQSSNQFYLGPALQSSNQFHTGAALESSYQSHTGAALQSSSQSHTGAALQSLNQSSMGDV